MTAEPEKNPPAFSATVGCNKPGRALKVAVVNGKLHLNQWPSDIIIVEREQLIEFVDTLNQAVDVLEAMP